MVDIYNLVSGITTKRNVVQNKINLKYFSEVSLVLYKKSAVFQSI